MSIADQLISRGWVQGTSLDEDGAVCLGWAINLEARQQLGVETTSMRIEATSCDQVLEAVQIASSLIEADLVTTHNLVNWNDTPGRTFDQVLRIAKQCDEKIEELKSLGK